MDWYNMRSKHSSVSAGMPYSAGGYGLSYSNSRPTGVVQQRYGGGNYNANNYSLLPQGGNSSSSSNVGGGIGMNSTGSSNGSGPSGTPNSGNSGNGILNQNYNNNTTDYSEKSSYYLSSMPLNCSDWVYFPSTDMDCIALSSYKEDFTNKLQIVHGSKYGKEATMQYEEEIGNDLGSPSSPGFIDDGSIEGFDFNKVAEISTDYPITNLQWNPAMTRGISNSERLATSSEVFRLYQIEQEDVDQIGNSSINSSSHIQNGQNINNFRVKQTHILANNTNSNGNSSNSSGNGGAYGNSKGEDANTFPPVTSFDWNKTESSIIITSSVDTTCTIWDLNRSHQLNSKMDTASVKTQLIAHDSEVFDVKFIHDSVNIFASVGNDGSIRVFDLRSLEHSTIIYEPPANVPSTSARYSRNNPNNANKSNQHYNSHALLKLSTSNIDQHHLATIGVNSNQVIIIDMRMPGVPVAKLDGSFDGMNNAAINSIKWHPNSNYLLSGGDDCQALVWDCNSLPNSTNNIPVSKVGTSSNSSNVDKSAMDLPILAYEADLEVNNVTWRSESGDWLGVVAGKGFQAVSL